MTSATSAPVSVPMIATPKRLKNQPTTQPTGLVTNDESPWPRTVWIPQLTDAPSDANVSGFSTTVISADDIRRAGVSDVNQAIRKIGGVYGRQSLDSSPDFSLDLRGFGANSNQNLVVVLDGVRMSENETLRVMLSWPAGRTALHARLSASEALPDCRQG